MMMSLVDRAMVYAIRCHEHAKYGDYPYVVHLIKVALVAEKYIHLIREEEREIVLAAIWLHDVIEDTDRTYNDIKTEFGVEVADIVYALSNELGKNRKERAEKTYPKTRENALAVFAKMCDRYSNTKFSLDEGSSMYKKYKQEYPGFRKEFNTAIFLNLWRALDELNDFYGDFYCPFCKQRLYDDRYSSCPHCRGSFILARPVEDA
jgi:(p)ppGpp synthase/HD superfamily hydrolase